MKKFFIVFLLFVSCILANGRGVIKGYVFDEEGRPLVGANVFVRDLYTGVATDERGFYRIELKPGKYMLEVSFIGYEKVEEKIEVKQGRELEKIFRLKSMAYKIGEIVVVAESELLPKDGETETTIDAGEIEHMQALSLNDALKLVPGQKFENPTLASAKFVKVRASTVDDYAEKNLTFGTQVVIDGIPVSNNANLQVDTRVDVPGVQRTSAGYGVDLRNIPADNIEEIEVIRGIPSARYGDMVSGVIKVKTKERPLPPRLKCKYNFRNQELNIGGNFRVKRGILGYNVNYARTIRDVRIPNDFYYRIAGQLFMKSRFLNNLLNLKNTIYYTRAFDEQGLRKGDLLLTERYNRDYFIRYSSNLNFISSLTSKFKMDFALSLNRQNSYSKRLISIDHTYITDRMVEGVQEGEFIQSYISRLWVKGRAWNLYLNAEYEKVFRTGKIGHDIYTGVNYRWEFNNGQGRIFDPMYPPSITSAKRERPRSYEEVPDLKLMSFYFEDRLKGKLLFAFVANLGFRYELYGTGREYQKFGAFFNPRFNGVVKLSENTQIRFGYGKTSKSPPASVLFPSKLYYDLDDINRYTKDEASRLVVVSTYIFEKDNPELKGYTQLKKEIGFDKKVGSVGISITGYINETKGGYAPTRVVPISLRRYDYPAWPDTSGRVVTDTVYDSYAIYENSQDIESRGIEFSLQTRSLTRLGARVRIEGAYNYTCSHTEGYDYSSSYRFYETTGQFIKPFWKNVTMEVEDFIIKYRFDFTIRELGVWVTMEAQQIVFEKDRYVGLGDSIAVGYIDAMGQVVFFDNPEEVMEDKSFIRSYPSWWWNEECRKGIFLFNLRVSKSLYEGAEFSFFVNNIFNYRPLYMRNRVSPGTKSYVRLNPELFFGVEFSTKLGKFK